MLVKPGPQYPLGGAVADGTRYTGAVSPAKGQTQFFANSRPTERFKRVNTTARNAETSWSEMYPGQKADWDRFFQNIEHWGSALCHMKALSSSSYWEGGLEGFTGVSCWRVAIGQPAGPGVPPINLQPGGDLIQLLKKPATPLTPPNLAASVELLWTALRIPVLVPVYVCLSARAQLTVPTGEPHPTKNSWGG